MMGVVGADGPLGRSMLAALSQRAPKDRIVAIVRHPHRAADLVQAGYIVRDGLAPDAPSLAQALQGVVKCVCVPPSGAQAGLAYTQALVHAAKRAGVSLVALTSVLRPRSVAPPWLDHYLHIEETLRAAQLPHVILRQGYVIEHLFDRARLARPTCLLGSAGHGRVSAASRADYASAAASVLTEPGHMNKTYELAGDSAITLTEATSALAAHTQARIAYRNIPPRELEAHVSAQSGAGAWAHLFARADAAIAQGLFETSVPTLSLLIGRPTTTPQAALVALDRTS